MKTGRGQHSSTSKSRGYILAVVLVFSFVLSTLILSAFTVLYRYTKAAELSLEQTRNEIYEALTDMQAEQYSGGENAGD